MNGLRSCSAGLLLSTLLLSPWPAGGQDGEADIAEIPIAYITQEVEKLPPLSLVDQPRDEEGLLGAKLGIEDSNTTGRFMKQHFTLESAVVPVDGDVVAAFRDLAAAGHRLFVADLPAEQLLAVADLPEAKDTLIFNVRAKEDALRGDDCRANILHVIPSYAMLADGLAQYLMWKRWDEWLLVVGVAEQDKLFADALRRSATRYNAEIVEERVYDAAPGARRSDTGHAQIQKQMPVFTQGVEYDILVVSDVRDAFGQYLPYRTWLPRPVVGTQGLVPLAWHRSQEQWGGTQMQNRFTEFAGRWMTERDYAAWAAVRSISEATTRTTRTDRAAIDAYVRSPDFGLGGFKGQKLTFREWDGQLRQPILLAEARTLVSVSPQEGFLHERSELDTLGVDQPESACRLQ
ncbi:MAG: ABC transporter substrate-binding protein [Alphaproteobacteria bacterium]|nr:MAG: ABC transporter substrate-binding protein [Alphaproteobacteria bacterium]